MIKHNDQFPYLLLRLALWNYYDFLYTHISYTFLHFLRPVEGHYTKCIETDFVQKPQ